MRHHLAGWTTIRAIGTRDGPHDMRQMYARGSSPQDARFQIALAGANLPDEHRRGKCRCTWETTKGCASLTARPPAHMLRLRLPLCAYDCLVGARASISVGLAWDLNWVEVLTSIVGTVPATIHTLVQAFGTTLRQVGLLDS